ncbi:MAG: peptidyl-prolyl cis-trans isomerase [Puniceicoccales bacterium]|jgi:hypothetical protein|nr:peptidyl-prolyl cis-trans isomerase [Puniceicoccales bacterium]
MSKRYILQLCPLLSAGILQGFTAQKNIYSNRVVAYVENDIITQQQIRGEMMLIANQGSEESEMEKKLWEEVLNTMIAKKMIAKEFERMKGQLPESYIQKKYDEIQKTRFDDDPLKLTKALQQQGKSKASYKAWLREEAIISFMYEHNVHRPNSVSPLDIQKYYQANGEKFIQGKRFDIDQIIIKKEDAIPSVRECLKRGYSYEECCQDLSQIPGISLNRMENIDESEIVPIIIKKIAKLPIGSFSEESIELNDQVIFLGLRNVREARTLSLDEAREPIEQTLLEKKYQLLRQKWLDQLKQKAYCVVI